MSKEISNTDDIIDIRDVIELVEELEDIVNAADEEIEEGNSAREDTATEEREELKRLTDLLEECRGNGGDEQWRGDWYPVTLIRDTYFRDYAEQFAEDIGAISRDVQWPYTCIDWDQAASELQMDYTGVDFDGITYWVR